MAVRGETAAPMSGNACVGSQAVNDGPASQPDGLCTTVVGRCSRMAVPGCYLGNAECDEQAWSAITLGSVIAQTCFPRPLLRQRR